MREGIVYLLVDPRDGSKRYIGRTVSPIKVRVDAHIALARRDKRSEAEVLSWIRELDAHGLRPEPRILEVLENGDDVFAMDAAERRHIAQHQARGESLLNMTPGGMGGPTMLGRKHTASAKEAVGIANRKEANPERAQKISESKRRMWEDPAYREKMTAAGRRGGQVVADATKGKPGRPHSEETKRKLRIAATGYQWGEDAKRKLSETLRGKPEVTHPPGWAEKVSATRRASIARYLADIDQSVVSDGMTRQDIADALGVTLNRVKNWRSAGILLGGRRKGTVLTFSRDEVLAIFVHYLEGGDATS